jgi:hypothetical protein
MKYKLMKKNYLYALSLLGISMLAGCATTPGACELAAERNLDRAFTNAKAKLADGCEAHFDSYFDQLLGVAAGDPQPANKQKFSDFLGWSADEGILSRRQAQKLYNRYFNVKFMALAGDYNNCAQTCPRKTRVLTAMEVELTDKERGLVKVSQDPASYYRADRLFQETELVLEATCTACANR